MSSLKAENKGSLPRAPGLSVCGVASGVPHPSEVTKTKSMKGLICDFHVSPR